MKVLKRVQDSIVLKILWLTIVFMEALNNSFIKLSSLLEKRFKLKSFTSEDWIRYAFYRCLSSSFKITPLKFSFEVPFESETVPSVLISRDCKLDALVDLGSKKYAFEIKFLREATNKTSTALCSSSGLLINDIRRLACINSETIEKYVLYVTDERFDYYFSNSHNNLDELYSLDEKSRPFLIDRDYIDSHCETFRRNANKSVPDNFECNVQGVFLQDYTSRYHIRVLQVL